jgi:membrane-anchored mycosin MYCP
MTDQRILRFAASGAVALMFAAITCSPGVQAISEPWVDPGHIPADGPPQPDQPMRQSNACARTSVAAEPNVGLPAPGQVMLNVAKAWQYSTGNGVSVAVIDTGVAPSARLPVVAGGDYIMGGDGLTDCDAHGTVVASVIAAAPQGIPMPQPMPPGPAVAPTVAPSVAGPPASEVPSNAGPPLPVQGTADEANAPMTDPEVPRPAYGAPDGVVGVAPHATIVSIRQSSRAYEPERPMPGDADAHRKAGTVATLAKAIVHAANMGVRVINISVTACVSAVAPLDQAALGAAVWYAATVKDAVIVAAAGNDGEDGCVQNPVFNPLDPADPRDWHQVKTISAPSWFVDYVLSVGAVDNTGAPIGKSLAGPWVGVAAPGVGIMGLAPQADGAVNAYPPTRPGEPDVPFWGTSFSAAYVSGVVALVRAKFPNLTAHQVINRIQQTAHNPPRGVDNKVGFGLVDPVAALTFDVPPGDRQAPGSFSRIVLPPAPLRPRDLRARNAAVAFLALIVGGGAVIAAIGRARRAIR